MLFFIGLGLHDEKDITLKGLEIAKKSDLIFAEFYTSRLAGTELKKIEGLIGKKIRIISREELEEGEIVLGEAEKKEVAVLVCGDPMVSTTHTALRIEAEKRGIKSRVVHNASIYSSAPSISGLFNYKFGKSATVPFFTKNFRPKSFYYVIKENLSMNLHTLLFLDIKEKMMTANEAMKILLEVENEEKQGIFTEEKFCVVLSQVGSSEPVIKAGKVRELIKLNFKEPPHTIIVPAELHFIEEEYLKIFGKIF